MGWGSAIVSGISNLLGAGAQAASVATSYKGAKEMRQAITEANEANIAFQRETNAQNEALQREQWQREDTALQRHVADATAAHVSPIGNINGSPSSLSTNMVAPTVDPVTSGDMDRALSDSFSNIASIMSNKSERQKERIQQREMQDKEHDHAIAVLDKQLASASDDKEKDRLNAFKMSCNQLKQLSLADDRKPALELTKQFQESVRTATGGLSVNFKPYSDYKEYKAALQAWNNRYYMIISSEIPQNSSETSCVSSSTSTSGGGNVGASLLGTGLNLGANGSKSQSQSSTSSTSTDEHNTPYYKVRSMLMEDPMPVYDETGFFSKIKSRR